MSIGAVRLVAVLIPAVIAMPAAAQDSENDGGSGRITRVTIGPQAYPAFPGADDYDIGPLVNWEGKRSASDVGADLPEVKFSIEPGAFVAFQPSESFRLRAELRKGVTGHKGWIGVASADFIVREGDEWLFSIGPRLTWSDDRYHDAWFGVTPAAAVTSGLPAYDPNGGIQAYGATATFLTQLSPRWGI